MRQPPSAVQQIRRSINAALTVAAAFYVSVACTVRWGGSLGAGERASGAAANQRQVETAQVCAHRPTVGVSITNPFHARSQGYASLGNATPSLVLEGFTGADQV